jgi:hypothetical protein
LVALPRFGYAALRFVVLVQSKLIGEGGDGGFTSHPAPVASLPAGG